MQLCEGGTLAGALEGGELSALPDVVWCRRCRQMGAPACGEHRGEGRAPGDLEQQGGDGTGADPAPAAAAAATGGGSGAAAHELQPGSAAATSLTLISADAPGIGAAPAAAAQGDAAATVAPSGAEDDVRSQQQACAGGREVCGGVIRGGQPERCEGIRTGTRPDAARSGSAAGLHGLMGTTCTIDEASGLSEQPLEWDELGPSPNLVGVQLAARRTCATDLRRLGSLLAKGAPPTCCQRCNAREGCCWTAATRVLRGPGLGLMVQPPSGWSI